MSVDPAYTVLIPAYNDFETFPSALRSLVHQSIKPSKVIVLDDCSEKKYVEVIEQQRVTFDPLNIDVIRSERRRGKAANINYALKHGNIDTPYLMVLDADTRVEPRYVEALFQEAPFDVAYGTVMSDFSFPSPYNYYRLVELIFGQYVTKQGTALIKALNIAGCAVMYQTEVLKEDGGYPTRTLTEDLDLAWIMHERKRRIVYVEGVTAYTREPSTFKQFNKQIHRWLGGFWQTIKVHGTRIGESNWLTLMLSIILFDVVIFTPFWISFLLGSFLLFLSRFPIFISLTLPLSNNVIVEMLVSTWRRWFPFALSEELAVISLACEAFIIGVFTFYKAKKLGCLRRAVLGLPMFYLLSWYAKFIWLKCGVKALFYKPPKETPIW